MGEQDTALQEAARREQLQRLVKAETVVHCERDGQPIAINYGSGINADGTYYAQDLL